MSKSQTSIHPSELKALSGGQYCLVDVREPVEYAEEHIEGSRLIPLGQLEKRIGEIDQDRPVIVVCRSGRRGVEALKKLESLGIEGARNLEGGILAWKSDGHAVNQSGKKTLPLMQQVQITIGLGVLAGVLLARLVNPDFIYLSAFFGAGLVFAGTTGWCGLAILMSKMPWNRAAGQTCSPSGSCSISN